MRIVILKEDSTVGVDGEFRSQLDFSSCGVPENFWAFQWGERGQERGHIEYDTSEVPNDVVTSIPGWALACVAKLQEKLDQEEAARIAAQEAAAAQQQPDQPE